jgi:hypothetical protein
VHQHFRVARGLEDRTLTHEHVAHLAGIHEIAVMPYGELAVDAVDDDWLCVEDAALTGGGIRT